MYYDMVRQARRGRFILTRFLYALALVAMLALACEYVVGQMTWWRWPAINIHGGAQIAKSYFQDFMTIQFMALVLVTPAYVAGAISEERQRKTLDLMFTTHLLDREIILDKFGSRVANLLLFAITGFPILSILQFLGGIDPDLVVASFVIAVVTILSHSCVSILCSVLFTKPRQSIAAAYLVIVSFYLVTYLLWQAYVPNPLATRNANAVPTLVTFFNVGSLFALVSQVQAATTTGSLAATLPSLLIAFSAFHGVISVAALATAVLNLRRAESARMARTIRAYKSQPGWGPETSAIDEDSNDNLTDHRRAARPRIGSNPLLWKELHRKLGKWSVWWTRVILAAGVIVAALTLRYSITSSRTSDVRIPIAIWVRNANLVVGMLTILAVGVRASSTIAAERENQSWDMLLTTTLGSKSIVNSFYLASIWNASYGLAFLGLILFVAFATATMDFAGILLVVLIWAIYVNFAATLGVFASASSRSSLVAIGRTGVLLVGIIVVHWMLWLHYAPPSRGGNFAIMPWDAVFLCLLSSQALMVSWVNEGLEQNWAFYFSGRDYLVFFLIFGAVFWIVAAEELRNSAVGRIHKMRSSRRSAVGVLMSNLLAGKKTLNPLSPNFAYASGSARSPAEPDA
jgi:ABC-type transport system involved in multi-copper enzyme maturation permease subunit